MQTGYVLFVNGELVKVPEGELAMDCMLPEGPPHNLEIMQSLFNSIPRDADHTAEMWTTVDPNKTNVRAKAVYKLLPGFSLYLVLMGKNIIFDGKIEQRYRELMIACNVQPTSGPVDTVGLHYMLAANRSNNNPAAVAEPDSQTMREAMEGLEHGMDADLFRRGVVRKNSNPKCRNKVSV